MHTNKHIHVSLLKTPKYFKVKNIPKSTTDNFGVWFVESTRGTAPSVFLLLPPHAPSRRRSLNGSPLRWQSPVVSFNQLPLSSVFWAPHLTTVSLSLPGKIKQPLLCQRTIPVPHPTCSLFSEHLYSDVHGRVAFVNLGCQADMWGEIQTCPSQLLYRHQWCEVTKYSY